jgi:hypothetical protein
MASHRRTHPRACCGTFHGICDGVQRYGTCDSESWMVQPHWQQFEHDHDDAAPAESENVPAPHCPDHADVVRPLVVPTDVSQSY